MREWLNTRREFLHLEKIAEQAEIHPFKFLAWLEGTAELTEQEKGILKICLIGFDFSPAVSRRQPK